MFFGNVCPARPSDTVTKYTIYPPTLLVERLFKCLAKHGSKMPSILLFEIEYLLEYVSKTPTFLSRPSDTKI